MISGTPTSISGVSTYIVTAANSGGSKTFSLVISVSDAQPKIEVLLTATDPLKQSDGTFNVDYRVKISNKGNTPLSNLELSVDLAKVFPAPIQFKILGAPKVFGRGVVSDGSFNGISNPNLIASSRAPWIDNFKVNFTNEPIYFAGDIKTEDLLIVLNNRKQSVYLKEALTNNSMLGSSELGLNDTALVIFSININPNGNFGPYSMNVLGTAQDQSGKVVSEISTDGQLVANSGITSIKYPTIVSIFPNPLLGASLNVQEIKRVNDNLYNVKFRAKIKNSGNLNLNRVAIIADLANQLKKPSSFLAEGVSLNTDAGLIINKQFDGDQNTNLVLIESAIGAGVENTLDFTLQIQPNGVYGEYSLQLALEAYSFNSNDNISNTTVDGTDPDMSLIKPGNNKATIFNLPFPGPRDLALDNNAINENNSINAIIGKFSASDMNSSAILSYSLVSGPGDTDNNEFEVYGSNLLTAEIFDFEKKSAYSIRIKATNQFEQSSEKNFLIAVKDINEAPTLDIIPDQRIFYTTDWETIKLNNMTPGPETNQEITASVSIDNLSLIDYLVIEDNNLRYKLKEKSAGDANIIVRVIDDGLVSDGGVNLIERSFKLTVDPLPIITASPEIITKGYFSNLLVSATIQSTYLWSPATGISDTSIPNPVARPLQTTTYHVKVTNQFGKSIDLSKTIIVNEEYNVMIPNVFSPNGDGINDSWIIENIENYPDHILTLLDRSGRILHRVVNYKNDWKGTVNGQPLEEGTYYYTLHFQGANNITKKGFLTIVK